MGPSGSGKTYSALKIAQGLGKKIAVVDTERGSASKYSGDVAEFDVCELKKHSPSNYIKAIQEAGDAGYDVLIIDSLTHAWSGKDGILEMVDNAKKRGAGNGFTAWREVGKEHDRLVDAMLDCPCHLIITLRTKMEYVIEEDERGKKVPRKIGLAPVQRDGLEYEFDIVGDMNQDHDLVITKSRCPAVSDAVVNRPGAEFARSVSAWLGDGELSEKDKLLSALRNVEFEDEFLQLVRDNSQYPDLLREIRPSLERKAGLHGVPWERVVEIVKGS